MSLIDPSIASYAWPAIDPHSVGWCDSTRCGQCADDEAVYQCESCGDTFETNEGCLHDGHAFCGCCFTERCAECRDDMRDAMAEERT